MRRSMLLLPFFFALLLEAQSRTEVVPLFTLTYAPPVMAGSDMGGILFSDRFAFFGTDGGLFRSPLPLGSAAPERVAFEWSPVTGLARNGDTLYVSLDVDHPTGVGASTRVLLKSTDDGASWTPIDDQLEECINGFCERLPSSQIAFSEARLFVNAGGNVLVSADEGASWSVLFGATSTGRPQSQACYDPSFALLGRRLLLGGECPLDSAYLRSGTLRPDLLQWESEPVAASTPFLENRNVQFIRARGVGDVVYVGIEGALMRSVDAGASYEFVLRFELDAEKYPYITHIAFPSAHPSAIVIGGFDKARGGPFLAVSTDEGATWRDDSHLLPGVGQEQCFVNELTQTPDGRLLIAVEDDAAGQLHVSEVRLTKAIRRRAVGHGVR